MQEGTNTTNLLKSSRFSVIVVNGPKYQTVQVSRDPHNHFAKTFSDVFPLKEFTTMGLMYLLEVPSLEEILNLGIHQIAAVLEQIPFPLHRIC